MLGSLNNILVYHAGGRLVLDEPFRKQPTEATVSITTLDGRDLDALGGGFTAISDVAADVSTLSLTLPATTLRQRNIAPSATAGFVAEIDELTDPGYALLLDRGGRILHITPSEYTVVGSDVTTFRLDDGLDFLLAAGDTAKGLRIAYEVDWSAVTSPFVGQVLATWRVTVNGRVQTIRKIYDVVRQVLHCPVSWQNVRARRADVDTQTSNLADKEMAVQQAWEDLREELRQRDVLYNLVIPDGSTALRDAVVYRCLSNLASQQVLNVPPDWNGGLREYLDWLEGQKSDALGALSLVVDTNEDGLVTTDEQQKRRRIWLRGKRSELIQTNKTSPS